MKFQPLTDSGDQEKRKLFWSIVGWKRRYLLRQLAERVENNINLEDYWANKDDLTIAEILIEAIDKFARKRTPLLPDDPIELVAIVVDPSPNSITIWEIISRMTDADWIWVDILTEIADRLNCTIPEEGWDNVKTVADFVTVIKSQPLPSSPAPLAPPVPRKKLKLNWWGIGCLTIWLAMTLLILYFVLTTKN